MDYEQQRGSQTAKDGFANEKAVAKRFNAWEHDEISRKWLVAMNYNLEEIEYVRAEVIKGNYKADVQVQVRIKLKVLEDCENLQVKLISHDRGYNQIDKRWVRDYKKMWGIPDDVLRVLNLYTGEELPYKPSTRDHRRMYMDEVTPQERELLLCWLRKNKELILCDIIKGSGKFAAEWYLVIKRDEVSQSLKDWRLKPINFVINYYGNGDIFVTRDGNIHIGIITMQRKGGDRGRPTAKMLQFKLDPGELFSMQQ